MRPKESGKETERRDEKKVEDERKWRRYKEEN